MVCLAGLFIEHCALADGAIFMDTITELIALDVMEAVEEEEPLEDCGAHTSKIRGAGLPPQPLQTQTGQEAEATKAAWLARHEAPARRDPHTTSAAAAAVAAASDIIADAASIARADGMAKVVRAAGKAVQRADLPATDSVARESRRR